jgi:hypothetical protein
MTITLEFALLAEAVTLIGTLTPLIVAIRKISNGTKCQLRKDMLDIYYHNRESKTIRQYEYENFVTLYEAYKALKGNSFIDKIYSEVKTWEVVT